MVIGVPSNRGEWDTISELNTYLSNLLGTPVDISTNGGSFEIHYEQRGTFARWDLETQQWAPNQTNGNLIFAAITGPQGNLNIGGYDFELAYPTNCTTAQSGDFSGRQCTTIVTLTTVYCPGSCSAGCDPPGDCFPNLIPNVESKIFEFEDGYLGFHFDAFPTPSWTWGYRRLRVLADEADMLNLYFDLNGTPVDVSQNYPSKDYDTESSSSSANSFYGGCGFGEATRGIKQIHPITSDGTAPMTVEECEEDLANL